TPASRSGNTSLTSFLTLGITKRSITGSSKELARQKFSNGDRNTHLKKHTARLNPFLRTTPKEKKQSKPDFRHLAVLELYNYAGNPATHCVWCRIKPFDTAEPLTLELPQRSRHSRKVKELPILSSGVLSAINVLMLIMSEDPRTSSAGVALNKARRMKKSARSLAMQNGLGDSLQTPAELRLLQAERSEEV